MRTKSKRGFLKWSLWQKKYFDTGIGLTSYGKYAVQLAAIYSLGKGIDINYTIILGMGYMFFCYYLGMFWVKKKLRHVENDIENSLNPLFVKLGKSLNSSLN